MKALVIFNPAAGDKERQLLSDALSRHFAAGRIEYEVYETRKGDQLSEIVRRRLKEGFDLVVAAGGDGTVSAVSDSLAGSSIPLGIIPAGTANRPGWAPGWAPWMGLDGPGWAWMGRRDTSSLSECFE